jgi:hypothetical protein
MRRRRQTSALTAAQRLQSLPGLPLGTAIVRGPSMEPTLHDGDRVLLSYEGRPAPGLLAIVRLPPQDDGTPRPTAIKRLGRHEEEGWWIERDNPDTGVDSWQVGAIPDDDVVALVVARLWPRPSKLRATPPDAGS